MLVYELGAGIGNMLPAIAISTIVSILATPFAGAVSILGHTITYSGTAVATTIGSIVGNLYIGASAAGNAKMSALIAGNDLKMSTLYGVISGLSETTLGILLGNIPGLIVASDLSLVGLLKEGVEEALQTYADAGLRKVMLREKIEWDEIAGEANKAFIFGVVTSAIMNGGQLVCDIAIGNTEIHISSLNEFVELIRNYNLIDGTTDDMTKKI